MAILIHSLSDFGQHLPANAVLSATTCGLLVALSRTSHKNRKSAAEGQESNRGETEDEQEPRPAAALPAFSPARLALAWQVIVLVLVAGIWTWAILGANQARVAESHWNKVLAAEHRLEADEWVSTEEAYDLLFTPADRGRPGRARQYSVPSLAGGLQVAVPGALHRSQHAAVAGGGPALGPEIADELLDARAVCPTFGASYCLAGEIEKFILKDPNGADHIAKGYELAPCDPTACIAAARIDAEANQVEEAFAKLVRAVQLDGRFFHQAATLCIRDLKRDDLAVQLAKEDANRLAFVGNVLSASAGALSLSSTTAISNSLDQQLAQQAQAEAFEQLKQKCERPDAPGYAHASLANLYQKQGDTDAAVEHYRRALMKDYAQVGWHYALAQLLADQNHTDEAIHEAKICLRLRSDYGPARRLIQRLSVLPTETK